MDTRPGQHPPPIVCSVYKIKLRTKRSGLGEASLIVVISLFLYILLIFVFPFLFNKCGREARRTCTLRRGHRGVALVNS